VENRIQKLIAIILGAGVAASFAAAPPRPFSHKYHLTQVSACENCHTEAVNSTKASDNLLPAKEACVMCHDEVHIMGPRPASGVQKFNHAHHVKMGSAAPLIAGAVKSGQYLGLEAPSLEVLANAKDACSGCHYGILASENVPHDKPVKAHFPQMADCLTCHSKIQPPESCKQCHEESTPNFRPTSHTADFGDTHSQKTLAKTGCFTCHGRKFTCKGCH
jgi:hypothetical protein